MSKECTACGFSPELPSKPPSIPEDCPKCHAEKSVVEVEESEDEE